MSPAAKKDKAAPVEPELVKEVPTSNEAAIAEAEEVKALIVEWDGQEWEVPPSFDDLDIDAVEAFALLAQANESGDLTIVAFAHVTAFLRSLLGPRQYGRLKKGRKVKDLNAFIDRVMQAYGAASTGE